MKAPQLRPRKLSIQKMIPNIITLGALASGMSAIKFAISEKWEAAVIALVAAAFMDAFDGAAARILKATSKLGAELDSLSDFVSFGVAPAIVVYLWSTHDIGRWGWFIALVYAMALALRLARFNAMKAEEDPNDPMTKYFVGVPAPLDAILCVLPLILTFMFEDHMPAWAPIFHTPMITGTWSLIIAALAVSHLPTFSSKQIRIPYSMRVPTLGLVTLMIAGLINDPWPTLTVLALIYVVSIPMGFLHYNRKRSAIADGRADPDDHDTDDDLG